MNSSRKIAIKIRFGRPFVAFREFLERTRIKSPKVFDFIYAMVPFAITIIGTLFPGILASKSGFRICVIAVAAAIYIWQWATLKNEMYRRLAEETKKRSKEIEEEYVVLNEYDVHSQEEQEAILKEGLTGIQAVQDLSLHYSTFSHKVSHNVKRLCTEFESDFSAILMRERVADFLKPAINSFEDVLSECYGEDIRASIKLPVDSKCFKTYARGTRNEKSRGRYKSRKQDEKRLLIRDNYAYDAIVNKQLRFFAEGELPKLHNKFKDDDVFKCEYKDYLSIFKATVVMPIRIPKFEETETKQEVIGLVCIDCKDTLAEWSSDNFDNKLGYHIIADFADSLALLIQAYMNRMNVAASK